MARRRGSALLVAAVLGLAAATPSAQPAAPEWPSIRLVPPDTERRHPELARVRDLMLAAIRERRLPAARALMASTIRDQDTDVPAGDVLASFGPLAAGESLPDEWRALEQALELGGIRRDGLYVVPFIEAAAPRWRGRHERLYVAGRDVAVRAEPDLAAAVVARVSHALVQEAALTASRAGGPASACPLWTPLAPPGRAPGWICTALTRPVSGLYYGFERVRGVWTLTRIWSLPD